jgi:putative transposase
MYPTFKKRQGKQSIQYPQNVKVLSDCQIKFPGKLGVVEARVHRDIEGKVKTVTLSKNPDGRYFASMLVDDGIECPKLSTDGNVVGIDLGLTDFAVTSTGSKYQHPRATKKHEKNLARKQKKLSRKSGKCGLGTRIKHPIIGAKLNLLLLKSILKSKESVRIFYTNYRAR